MASISLKLVFSTLLIFFLSCSEIHSIKVGVIGDFTHVDSQMAISGRNGLILGINEINESGGILGQQIELISINHNNEKELAYNGVKELISLGVGFVIGPFINSMTQPVQVASLNANILVVSPTVNFSKFIGIDDNLLRLTFGAEDQGYTLSNAIKKNKNNNIAVILDESNIDYCLDFLGGLTKNLIDTEINIQEVRINNNYKVERVTNFLIEESFDGLVFITNGHEASRIIKGYNSSNKLPHLYGSDWVKQTNILLEAGDLIEGMILSDGYENNIPNKKETNFFRKYYKQYTSVPTISSKYSYEAIHLYKVLLESFNSTNITSSKLKEAIVSMEQINGLSEDYTINKTGDAIRSIGLFQVVEGHYKLINQ